MWWSWRGCPTTRQQLLANSVCGVWGVWVVLYDRHELMCNYIHRSHSIMHCLIEYQPPSTHTTHIPRTQKAHTVSHTHTHTQTYRHRNAHTQFHKQRLTQTHTHTCRQKHSPTQTETDVNTHGQHPCVPHPTCPTHRGQPMTTLTSCIVCVPLQS